MRIGTKTLLGVALSAVAFAGSAQAQEAQYAHAAITSGKLTQAERDLARDARAGSREPEVLLNLAAVYAMTDRPAEARVLYQRVLGGEDASLVLASSEVASAHAIARKGLGRLDRAVATRITAR